MSLIDDADGKNWQLQLIHLNVSEKNRVGLWGKLRFINCKFHFCARFICLFGLKFPPGENCVNMRNFFEK